MSELLQEALREIGAAPLQFAAEAAQSLFVIGLLWWFGRRWLIRRLAERREGIVQALAGADEAERESVRMSEESLTVVAQAQEAASAMLQGAREEAGREREVALAAMETGAGQAVEQARASVELEKASIRRETSERLVRLTTEAARRYLDEMLTEAERRTLTQKAILSVLGATEAPAEPVDAGAT
jgi:F0F1-type ATP synthase membrane subunit b/b'